MMHCVCMKFPNNKSYYFAKVFLNPSFSPSFFSLASGNLSNSPNRGEGSTW